MAAVNGVSPSASPPPDTLAPHSKRKHDDIGTHAIVNGENTSNDRHPTTNIRNSLRDIWLVLGARQDVSPNVFQRISSYENTRATPDQESHPSKRQKLSPSMSKGTIASKIDLGRYESFEEFLGDVEHACSDMITPAQAEDNDVSNTETNKPTELERSDQQRLQISVAGFKKIVDGLVDRERQHQQLASPAAHESRASVEDGGVKVNGTQHSASSTSSSSVEQSQRAVLTIFGNAQGPKQLFSSFQKPLSKWSNASSSSDTPFDAGAESLTSSQEASLPIGLFQTNIMQKPKDTLTKGNRPRRTLHDLFPPPSNVRFLVPPKTPKLAHSRESITWSRGSTTESTSRSGGISTEKLATGVWLGYGGLAPAEEPSSPQAKRKQRDRALSSGEASSTPSHDLKAAQLQAEEEALFRSAYASFAPSRDNSAALIPEEIRNEVWWDKYGTTQFHQMLATDSPIELEDDMDAEETENDKEARFREAVENFIPPSLPEEEPAQGTEDREAEQMLLEISQMLETLHSYQRIRMSSLSAGSRASLVQNSQLQDLTGNPSTPSSAEVETYKTLKAQLALIVAMLPPYAVAKLNGDQLADLQISTDIPIEVEGYRGVMEEDKASRGAKQAALQAAVGVAGAGNRPTPLQTQSNHPRNSQMSPSTRGYGPNQIQYGNNPQSMSRAQPHFSRQSLSNWQKPNQNIASTTQRPSYANPSTYNQQMPRNAPTPLRQPYTPIAQNRPISTTQQLPNGTNYSNVQYPGQQRIIPHGSPTQMSSGNGPIAPPSSPSKSMQQNYQSHLHNSSQLSRMQTSYSSQPSPSQGVGQVAQSPQRPPSATQINPSPLPPTPTTGQVPGSTASPAPRPSSSGAPAEMNASGEAEGVAVTSRTPTPSSSSQARTQQQPQVPPVANMTSA